MSSIDERIVRMQFDNGEFERRTATTTASLDKLKNSLNLKNASNGLNDLHAAAKGFTLGSIGDGIDAITAKFSALAVAGIAALASIVVAAVSTGLQIVRSLTFGPILQGFDDYNRKLTSVQTIMNATGQTIEVVNGYFTELDLYADKTIYNLANMTSAFAKFTNAGIAMDKSVPAIKGIANMVALAGQDANAAAIAFYNLSQSIAGGFLTRIDFKSLELQNVATKEWKDHLIAGAIAAGTLKKEASGLYTILTNESGKTYTAQQLFIDGLQEGFATTEVLLEVLGNYGDTTTAIGAKAQAAAQDIKSMSMMMETLKASVGTGWTDTFELFIGDLHEAKALFTPLTIAIQSILDSMTALRNDPLKEWKRLGGRTMLIMALSNALEYLRKLIAPITRAFNDIFPPVTGVLLQNMTLGFLKFTAALEPTWKTINNLRRTFAGFFAILHIGWTIIKQVGRVIGELLAFIFPAGEGILAFTGNIGDFFVALDKAINKGEGLTKFFDGLATVIKIPLAILQAFFALIGAAIDNISTNGQASLAGFGQAVIERFKPIAHLGTWLASVWQGLVDVFVYLHKVFKPISDAIGKFVLGLSGAISSGIRDQDFGSIADFINAALLGGIFLMIKNFIDKISSVVQALQGGTGIGDYIKNIFQSLSDVLVNLQNKIKAQTLLAIAAAVGILAISVIALSLVDPIALGKSLAAITIMMAQLFAAMAVFQKIVGLKGIAKLPLLIASMILLGIALNIMAVAVSRLAKLDWVGLAKGLVGVTVLMGVMAGASQLMSKNAAGMIRSGAAMILFAFAIKVMADAVIKLASLTWEDLTKGLLGLAGVMGIIVVVTSKLAESGKIAGVISTAIALVILASALKIMASAVHDFADLSWEDMVKGITGIGGALVAINIGLKGMSANIPGAIALVIVAAALNVLVGALEGFGAMSWEEIGKAATVLAGSLGLIATALNFMGGAIPGALALIVVSGALLIMGDAFKKFAEMSWDDIGRAAVILAGSLLIIAGAMALMGFPLVMAGSIGIIAAAFALMTLAPALILLGTMSWDEIGRGLAVLASALGILAVGGILMIPAAIGLMGLGVAIILIGTGTAIAAIGITALAVALTLLSIAGSGALGVLMQGFEMFIALIPTIALRIGEGLIQIAVVISQNGPILIAAFTTVMLAMLASMTTLIPEIVTFAVTFITALVKALVVLIPLVVDAGLKILGGILAGLAKNIGKIATQGYNIIIALINALAKKIPDIVKAAGNLVLAWINGITNYVKNNSSRFVTAGSKLFRAIIDGVSKAIEQGGSDLAYAGQRIGAALLQGAMNAIGAKSPSKRFFEVAGYAIAGLVNGVKANLGFVTKSSESIGDEMLRPIKTALSSVADAVSGNIDMTPQIRPVLDLSDLKKNAALIPTMLGTPKLSVDTSYAQAAALSAEIQAVQNSKDKDENKTSDTSVINYTQINNSPKALDPIEIYRNTNNQLSKAKEELAPNAT